MICRLFLRALTLALLSLPAFASSFVIGVAPHSSARVIIEMYQPLRLFLEKTLGQPVEIVTAPDFTEFARRAMAQKYDIAITTGHQARLLESDAAYRPLLTYQADFLAVAIVARDSPYRKPADLAGTTVFGLSPTSLVTLWGKHWLKRNSLGNVTMKFVSASDSTASLVIKGEGAAAFHSLANFQNLPAAVREQLHILDESVPLAGRVYMLNGRHGSRFDKVSAALWHFAETPEAQQYFTRHKLTGYRKLGARELNEMEPYANEVREVLRATAR